MRRAIASTLAAAALAAGCAAPAPPAPPLPEPASGLSAKAEARASRFMVSAGHPLAVDAGVSMLRRGGSAVDAAVAVQLVLALVEPQASGIGGGGFALTWDGRTVQAWDGRETAPAAAAGDLFLGADGRPLPFAQAAVGGRAVGVPGTMRLLEALHRAHGRLPWAALFEPAIALAEQGFEVGPRMHALLQAETALRADPRAAAYFYRADGMPHPVGQRLRNPALAEVYRRLAAGGAAAFYGGAIAADLVQRVQQAAPAGRLAGADLDGYAAIERAPICTDWRTRWRVCGMPPPASGHLALMQTLALLEQASPPAAATPGVPSAPWLHVYLEAARLAFADRARYVADPAFVAPPDSDWRSLLAPDYLARRAALIGPRAQPDPAPGEPGATRSALGDAPAQPEGGTSQISIVDAEGRAVSLTGSIQTAWGSRLLVDGGTGLPGGFLLNNQLTDFSFAPTDPAGRPLANRVEPGKRPRSSMSPTLVFDRADHGRLHSVGGSTLGPMIIHSMAKVLLGTLAWGLGPQAATDLPNFGFAEGPVLLERGRFPAATVQALRDRGHRVSETELATGVQLLQRAPAGGWLGAADPRKEGIAAGD